MTTKRSSSHRAEYKKLPPGFWLKLRIKTEQFLYHLRYCFHKFSSPLEMWAMVQKNGRGIERDLHVSCARQYWTIVWMVFRYAIHPEHYYWFRLFLPGSPCAGDYVHPNVHSARVAAFIRNSGADITKLTDKSRFAKFAAEFGLEAPREIARFEDGSIHWSGPEQLPHYDLFSKEAAGGKGAGAESFEYVSDGHWRTYHGVLMQESTMLQDLLEKSKVRPLILQEKLIPHPEIQDLSPGGISTLRVMTTRNPKTGRVSIFTVVFKLQRLGHITDHWQHVGHSSLVDIETGVLIRGRYRDLDKSHLHFDIHPDTQARVTGRQLPMWKELVEACIHAQASFSEFTSIGWDVAITNRGIVFLEGNINWGTRSPQQVSCIPFTHSNYLEDYRCWHHSIQWTWANLPKAPHYQGWHL